MRSYIVVSALVFGVVTLLHVLRLALGWPAQIGDWTIPLWISAVGVAIAGALSAWGFRLLVRPA